MAEIVGRSNQENTSCGGFRGTKRYWTLAEPRIRGLYPTVRDTKVSRDSLHSSGGVPGSKPPCLLGRDGLGRFQEKRGKSDWSVVLGHYRRSFLKSDDLVKWTMSYMI